jgi:N-acetylmuramoyl-L-alanine amidase
MSRKDAVWAAPLSVLSLSLLLAVGLWHDSALAGSKQAGSKQAGSKQAGSKETVANDARLAGDRQRTRFIADLSKKVDIHVFALDNPYRVIVDLPEVSFQMPAGLGKAKRGLVTAFRYGLFAPGKSRIVLDVGGPFLIDKAFVLGPREEQPARLVIDLVPATREAFLGKLAALKPPPVVAEETTVPAPKVSRPPSGKPVIVLDPGHGGVDPGAISANDVAEKEVVLAFAKRLKGKLEESGRYEVFLTRDDDSFRALRKRVEFAQGRGADLFLSIHADSLKGGSEARGATRGATVYTLSERASDEAAKELAAKENFADAIAGSELPEDSDEVVADILIDLAQRETQNRSLIFARSVVSELDRELHPKPMKSAGFRVLKAPDVPSVLIELGFLSNAEDEKLLTSEAWSERTAVSVAKAVDAYFAKRIARMPF